MVQDDGWIDEVEDDAPQGFLLQSSSLGESAFTLPYLALSVDLGRHNPSLCLLMLAFLISKFLQNENEYMFNSR